MTRSIVSRLSKARPAAESIEEKSEFGGWDTRERTTGARGVLSYLGRPRRTNKEVTDFAAIDIMSTSTLTWTNDKTMVTRSIVLLTGITSRFKTPFDHAGEGPDRNLSSGMSDMRTKTCMHVTPGEKERR